MTRDRRKRDVARWREAGWVTADGERAILAELDDSGSRVNLPNVFGIIAAILLGCAVLTFVASNWQEMSRLQRLMLLGGALVATYTTAGVLFERGLPGLAQGAVLLGVLIYGASIMLISQMYHIDGHPPDGVLLWAAGALAAGFLLRSTPAHFAALGLFALWSVWESSFAGDWGFRNNAVHWPFPLALAAVAAGFAQERSRQGLKACAVALTAWVLSIGLLMPGGKTIVPVIGAIVVLTAIAIEHVGSAARTGSGSGAGSGQGCPKPTGRAAIDGMTTDTLIWLRERLPDYARSLLFYGAAILFGGVLMNMLAPELGSGHRQISWAVLVVWYAAGLVLSVAAIWYGTMTSDRALARLAYTAFAATILIIFFRTVGSLMGTSAFFLIAGLVAVGLAYAGWRMSMAASGKSQIGEP